MRSRATSTSLVTFFRALNGNFVTEHDQRQRRSPLQALAGFHEQTPLRGLFVQGLPAGIELVEPQCLLLMFPQGALSRIPYVRALRVRRLR